MRSYLRSLVTREAMGQFLRLGLIGGLNTIVYFVLLNVLFSLVGLSAFWSVTWAFVLATALSYVLNRRWTFQIKEGRGSLRETVVFYVVNLAAWGATVGMVELAEKVFGTSTALQINLASLVATAIILIPKFASYRDLVFKKALGEAREGGKV
ncbi:MAG: GtrA family protein [Acidimicrobiia bacterium]|nr:GtrA family protein [Acidimicrobiia bacterium]MDH3398996.1 GtrA family protein [Acidimicrobiia bacterium]